MQVDKKRMLFVAKSPHAYSASGGRTRVISVSKLHQRLKYNVRLVSFVPLRLFIFKRNYLKKARYNLALEASCKVLYIPELPALRNKFLIKIKEYFSVAIIKYFLLKKYDIFHCHGLAASYLVVKAIGEYQSNKFITADIHGAAPEEAMFNRGLDFNHPKIEELNNKERLVYSQADLCIFVSQNMLSHVISKYRFEPRNYIIIPCATDSHALTGRSNEIRKVLDLEDKLAFVYLGSFRKYQMAAETIGLFKSISEKILNVKLIIFTSHVKDFECELLNQRINSNLYEIKTLSRHEVPKYLASMDIGFMLRSEDLLNKVASPTKFAEYLIAGVPVITTAFVGDYSEIVEKNNLGYVVNSFSANSELLRFINDLKMNRENYRLTCSKYSNEHLTWDGMENIYKATLESLVSKK